MVEIALFQSARSDSAAYIGLMVGNHHHCGLLLYCSSWISGVHLRVFLSQTNIASRKWLLKNNIPGLLVNIPQHNPDYRWANFFTRITGDLYMPMMLLPTSVWMTNCLNWEFGSLLVQISDFHVRLRNDISRVTNHNRQKDYKDWYDEHSLFSTQISWLFPPTEVNIVRWYHGTGKAISYRLDWLNNSGQRHSFIARADNLAAWLGVSEKPLGQFV